MGLIAHEFLASIPRQLLFTASVTMLAKNLQLHPMRTNSISGLNRTLALFALLLTLTATARAQLTLLTGGHSASGPGGPYTLGTLFTVGAQPITISQLGVFDQGTNGLATSHDVGIWTSGGTLLGQATVPSGTSATLIGEFRYTTLSGPLVLTAGQSYVIGAVFQATGDAAFFSDGTSTFSTAATGYSGRYVSTTSLAFPTATGPSSAFYSANAVYVVGAVPEPSTYALGFGVVALGLAAYRRRSHRLRA